MERIFPLLLVVALCGCVAGPTKDFYKPTGATVSQSFKGTAALIKSQDIRRDVEQNGGIVIGTSDYIGKYPAMVELTTQAKRVGASAVVFNAKYLETISGVSTFTVQNPDQTITSQHYGTVNGSVSGSAYDSSGRSAYGSASGTANYYGQTTTTVPGGYSQHQVPYAFDRFEVHAVFLGK